MATTFSSTAKFLRDAGKTLQDWGDTVLWKQGGFDITLEEVVLAIAIVLAGRWIGKRLGNWVAGHLPGKIRGEPDAPRTLYLAFWAPFWLLALRVLGIPLTALGFLGGAIALGFGFGAQNICNNLISGGILKLGRPIGPGDVVELDGRMGTVQSVGFRATEIRTFDGVRMLIPNSNVLSTTIVVRATNPTLLRGSFAVGVAYASDSEKVERILREIVEAHPLVIHRPDRPNRVFFSDFSDSALVFQVLFWADADKTILDDVAGSLRHAILKAFRKEGISIPFPQLDLHFDRRR